MSTGSTKSRNRKQPAHGKFQPSGRGAVPATEAPAEPVMSTRTWLIACAAILLVAALLRVYDLNLVPLHHDEGVNGNFLVRLVREGAYQYDPANYHGPTLYYLAAIYPWILRVLFGVNAQNTYGLTTIAIRCVPALFGLATIGLIFTLRRNLGSIATLAAGTLLAVSPGAIYLSRYFIHETLFVFFTFGIVVAAVKYFENPHPLYLLLGSVSAALLFATKETALISVAVLAIALGITQVYPSLWQNWYGNLQGGKTKRRHSQRSGSRDLIERAGGPTNVAIWLTVALAVFILVNVLFYSSFFTNFPKGVYDSVKTFQFWTKTGKEAHLHPPVTYIWWLLLQEAALLTLGAIGAMIVVLRPVKPFPLFAALWAFGLTAAYSLIGYKTPWLTLNFIVPLALISGYALEWLFTELGKWEVSRGMRWLALAGILLVVTGPLPGLVRAVEKRDFNWQTYIPGFQAIDLNFINYDNDNRYYVYVYAHTRRETLQLVNEINRLAQRTHQGGETGITIVSPDYWPLPWYLRDYKRVGYFGRMNPSTEPIVIAKEDQAAEVQKIFGERYQLVHSGFNAAGTFPLRPGVNLLLFARRELVR